MPHVKFNSYLQSLCLVLEITFTQKERLAHHYHLTFSLPFTPKGSVTIKVGIA